MQGYTFQGAANLTVFFSETIKGSQELNTIRFFIKKKNRDIKLFRTPQWWKRLVQIL